MSKEFIIWMKEAHLKILLIFVLANYRGIFQPINYVIY
jgi:hypothetical protein